MPATAHSRCGRLQVALRANITTLEAMDAEAFAVEAEMAPVEPAA